MASPVITLEMPPGLGTRGRCAGRAARSPKFGSSLRWSLSGCRPLAAAWHRFPYLLLPSHEPGL